MMFFLDKNNIRFNVNEMLYNKGFYGMYNIVYRGF